MSHLKTAWSIHTHSVFSANDAMSSVKDLVETAVLFGHPALGLTDHGTVSGAVDLYKSCRKAGIEPLPGVELYITHDRARMNLWGATRKVFHLTINAYSERGYRNLVTLTNLAGRNFHYKPLLDLADLADLAERGQLKGLSVATGCYFGIAQQLVAQRGPAAAKQVISALAGWFDRVYVELHDHGVDHGNGYTDADMALELVTIAEELGLPYVIAQDSHYTLPEQQYLHDALKTLITFSEDVDEAKFPGGPYSLMDMKQLSTIWDPQILGRATDALDELAHASHVRLPELETFSLKVPDVTFGGDPETELRKRVLDGLVRLDALHPMSAKRKKEVTQRVNAELDTIFAAQMPGYILLIADICAFMRSAGIWFQARGSAGGSFACYALEITQVDPLQWRLFMERFMSADRTRPPDVDLDVEHRRRHEVVAWLGQHFAIRQVGSFIEYGLSDEDDEEEGKGSLLVRYFTSQRKRGNPVRTWNQTPAADRRILNSLAGMGLFSGPGTHAAGYIVAPDEESLAELPLTWMAKQNKFVTAFDKKGVEALGFCKVDLLGLRNLTARRVTLEAIFTTDAERFLFWERIPDSDAKTAARLADGATDGIFQLDGATQRRGATALLPRNAADVVAMQAIYRPAILQAHQDRQYLARRSGAEKVPERHSDIDVVTAETFGILLYQEQIISLLRLAGMSPAELTDTLDAVKASNANTAAAAVFLAQTKPRISQLLTDRGWPTIDIEWFNDGLLGYAEYSFNKAHSAQYGVAAWRSAWLATHYTTEFWLGVLTAYDDHKREMGFISAARRNGVAVLTPHVNSSGHTYRLEQIGDRTCIRRGLLSVKGVGPAAAAELALRQPFTSLRDLGERCHAARVSGAKHLAKGKDPVEAGGKVAALFAAGALAGLS